jgi:LCP family protein required for cell wall assembly
VKKKNTEKKSRSPLSVPENLRSADDSDLILDLENAAQADAGNVSSYAPSTHGSHSSSHHSHSSGSGSSSHGSRSSSHHSHSSGSGSSSHGSRSSSHRSHSSGGSSSHGSHSSSHHSHSSDGGSSPHGSHSSSHHSHSYESGASSYDSPASLSNSLSPEGGVDRHDAANASNQAPVPASVAVLHGESVVPSDRQAAENAAGNPVAPSAVMNQKKEETVPAARPADTAARQTVSAPPAAPPAAVVIASNAVVRKASPSSPSSAAKEKKKKDKESKKKDKQSRAIIALAAMLVLLFSGLYLTMNHYLNKIHHISEVETIPPGDEDFETGENDGLNVLSPDDVRWNSIAPLGDEELINILFVGQDRRPGQGRQRSDTMILCSINAKKKKVALISFLRDLYVQIPGYTDNRLNAAYVFGGFPLLKDSLKKNFGVTVDGCFEVDFDGFIALIDEIHGVDLSLTAEEAKVVGNGAVEGENHLDGKNALAYARIRKLDSDFGRTNRQRKVLLAAYSKIMDCTLQQLLSLLNQALPYLTTDMTNGQIFSLASKVFQLLTKIDIRTYYIPPDGTYSYVFIRGMSVLYPDLKAIREILISQYMPF